MSVLEHEIKVSGRDWSMLTRKLNLVRFFDQYERMHSEGDADASELAERADELQITDEEWADYYAAKEKEQVNF